MAKKSNKRNALGRGLSALLSDTEQAGNIDLSPQGDAPVGLGSVAEIPIEAIETNPYQPRTHFDLVALEELAESIRVQGIIQPITVRKMGDAYQLISGERRFRASQMAELTTIPAYVRTADDEQMLEMALIENIQRHDLNPIEIAMGYQRLIEELGLKQEELGEKVGKKRATITNFLRLLKLPPELQLGLRNGKISMGHARALISVDDRDHQLEIYRKAIEEGLSVRKVEELVRSLSEPKAGKASKTVQKNPHLRSLEQNLEEHFGSKVVIRQTNNGKGELRLHFDSTEDLNRILDLISTE